MKVVIQFDDASEAKALPILLRHSPGSILPNRTYVISDQVIERLRVAGISFVELSREADAPSLEGAGAGERI